MAVSSERASISGLIILKFRRVLAAIHDDQPFGDVTCGAARPMPRASSSSRPYRRSGGRPSPRPPAPHLAQHRIGMQMVNQRHVAPATLLSVLARRSRQFGGAVGWRPCQTDRRFIHPISPLQTDPPPMTPT